MERDLKRRAFLGVAGAMAAGAAGQAAFAQEAAGKGLKIVGIATSPRKGMTTAAAVRTALDAAKAAAPGIETELIELAGLSIPGQLAAGLPLEPGQKDDFPALVPKLSDPNVAGIIIGSPVYFNNMSYLCKAFLDRCIAFRKQGFSLSGKVAGALAVGGARNGGQETTVQSIQGALTGQEMIIVGTSRPTGRAGATLWAKGGDISGDDFGLSTAKDLGTRVVQVAARMAGAKP